MAKKKIGLLNLQYIDNYGANLIAFAMEKMAKEINEDAYIETINYSPDENKVHTEAFSVKNYYIQFGFGASIKYFSRLYFKKIKWTLRYNSLTKCLKKVLRRDINNQSESENLIDELHSKRLDSFSNYRSRYLNISKSLDINNLDKQEYDAIIVGSDVVWKPHRLLSSYVNKAFFLKTEGNYKRIAYAASLGISDKVQMERLTKHYKDAIKDFDAISIRESSGTEYIQKLFPERKIWNCIDPVFLRPANEYEELIENNENKDPYIYAYILGKNPEAVNYVERVAKEKNLKIFYHSNKEFKDGINTYTDGPCEFLSRIKNAEYVVTDSFHGTAFSIIFRKQFFSFTRGVLSVRLQNFMTQIGLKDRLLSVVSENTDIDAPIPYDDVWEGLSNWINESKRFLTSALNEEEQK